MAIYPGGSFVPTAWGGKTPRRQGQRGILHVAVSNAANLPPWSQNTWHFYVNKAGEAFQYVDTQWCAWANIDANSDAISIETQGGMGTSAELNAEPWTDAQAARIADIMRWANAVEGIPLEALPDSKAGRRGWGTHRLGIDPWRVPGGQSWSGARGKECPGNAKVAQLPAILQLAQQGDDMPLTDADVQKLWWAGTVDPVTGKPTVIIELLKAAALGAANAARDAAVARKLAEQAAAAGRPLTVQEIHDVGAEVAKQLGAGFDVNLTPKPAA